MPRTEHDQYHERWLLVCMAGLLADLLLIPLAIYGYGSPEAAKVFLLPALPVAAGAIAHWLAGLRTVDRCTCGKSRLIR